MNSTDQWCPEAVASRRGQREAQRKNWAELGVSMARCYCRGIDLNCPECYGLGEVPSFEDA